MTREKEAPYGAGEQIFSLARKRTAPAIVGMVYRSK